jgi:beta-lactamase class A
MKQLALLFSLVSSLAIGKPAFASDSKALQPRLVQIVGGFPGRVGISIQDGSTVAAIKPQAIFPLQSVMKIVVAAAVLDKVDHGQLHLADKLIVRRSNLSVYVQPIAALVTVKGYSTTLGDIIRRAIVDSDNAAADILFTKAGGARGIAKFLSSKGVGAVRVDRREREVQTEIVGLKWQTRYVDQKVFEHAIAGVPKAKRDAEWKQFLVDPRDTASPSGMRQFLQLLSDGKLVSKDSTKFLLDAMHATKVSSDRLAAGLAPGWSIAHKSGTSGTWNGVAGATNDVGILTAPDGTKICVVVFISASTAPEAKRAALIADVARAVVESHTK